MAAKSILREETVKSAIVRWHFMALPPNRSAVAAIP
jgi:hypothetical protein